MNLSLTSGTMLVLTFHSWKKKNNITESLCQSNVRNFLVCYEWLLLGGLSWSGT